MNKKKWEAKQMVYQIIDSTSAEAPYHSQSIDYNIEETYTVNLKIYRFCLF